MVLLREFEHAMDFLQTQLRRRLVVRDAADAVDAEPDRALEPLLITVAPIDAVLRERRDLDRAQLSELVPHTQQAAHHRLVLSGDVGVRADEERALRSRPAHDLGRPVEDVLLGQRRLQLAPDVNAFDQRAALVEPGPSDRQRRVEVQVAVDKRRRHEPPGDIDGLSGLAAGDEAPAVDEEIARRPIHQARVLELEVDHGASLTRRGAVRISFSP